MVYRNPSFKGRTPASKAASRAKKANRGRDTKPELALRQEVWSRGLRYRIHVAALPGRPDLVFPRQRVAVFVDGDFWHGRNWEARKQQLERVNNAPYWIAKVGRNRERDREQEQRLAASGWTVLRFWEGEVMEDAVMAADLIEAVVAVAANTVQPK